MGPQTSGFVKAEEGGGVVVDCAGTARGGAVVGGP